MSKPVSIGIIGDFNEDRPSHKATNKALRHAVDCLSTEVNIAWISTASLLTSEGQQNLEQFTGLLASPGSPYQSMKGALKGIQFARETNRSFLGT
jgi:CTP synthase (UTP-ammonia lyase)